MGNNFHEIEKTSNGIINRAQDNQQNPDEINHFFIQRYKCVKHAISDLTVTKGYKMLIKISKLMDSNEYIEISKIALEDRYSLIEFIRKEIKTINNMEIIDFEKTRKNIAMQILKNIELNKKQYASDILKVIFITKMTNILRILRSTFDNDGKKKKNEKTANFVCN